MTEQTNNGLLDDDLRRVIENMFMLRGHELNERRITAFCSASMNFLLANTDIELQDFYDAVQAMAEERRYGIKVKLDLPEFGSITRHAQYFAWQRQGIITNGLVFIEKPTFISHVSPLLVEELDKARGLNKKLFRFERAPREESSE